MVFEGPLPSRDIGRDCCLLADLCSCGLEIE